MLVGYMLILVIIIKIGILSVNVKFRCFLVIFIMLVLLFICFNIERIVRIRDRGCSWVGIGFRRRLG